MTLNYTLDISTNQSADKDEYLFYFGSNCKVDPTYFLVYSFKSILKYYAAFSKRKEIWNLWTNDCTKA